MYNGMAKVQIPTRLLGRPTWNGMVVPYGTIILSDGRPDFTTNDETKRIQCLKDRLCPICGDKLDYWIYFIGGDKSYASRAFVDPAMHEECARYSMAACPFLRGDLQKYREVTKSMSDSSLTVLKTDMSQQSRPERMGLFKTRNFKIVVQGGSILAVASAWVAEEWF